MLPPLPLSEIEVRQIRASTPAAEAFVHLNHASASLPDNATLDALRGFIDLEARVGMHRALETIDASVAELPQAVASLLGVHARQIAICESASRGWALALSAVAPRRRLQVFVSAHEWGGNVNTLLAQPRVSMEQMPGAPHASWDAIVHQALEQRDRDAVPVVSLPLIGSARGEVHRLDGVASAVRDAGGWLFVDASQAVGQIPVNAETLGADVLVFPARKWLRGPRGVAALCLSQRALAHFEAPAMLDTYGGCTTRVPASGHLAVRFADDARRFQLYEHHPALRLGMLAAVRAVQDIGVERIHAYTRSLCERLHAELDDQWDCVHLDRPASGLLCVSFAGVDAAQLAERLWRRGINTACVTTSRYAPLAYDGENSPAGVLRISPHAITLPEEIDRLLVALREECRLLATV
ncbi:aminotransferase class V-fold PLP-dependent enzyme [Burkholderia sp. Ac-20353]|uniref:aminotransferase class V-fold PLP-dependent enzyme n=1 Tax=Burkholderia sp. Ac-20353 TaxID=2703894 RepID=UPI001F1195CF|nr:aminotransferase class V-fold PLP-dependent enzyme [Burkholderia sp. Ac-20353]MBN3786862.1 aminotransferase class V-fold PLP-dependent enzyme [Burkholderia sp. Ac-20353]